ncbi:HAD family hydrolase [Streptomyces stackebrandtii]|uniref:hypothetical protein n=1 Tax=Streptomyces stackebrandtii TaxID=3051177 RepID=UPI0028DCBA87|nr:hypothetical protein [Streptomyces sp. DSM 40976]
MVATGQRWTTHAARTRPLPRNGPRPGRRSRHRGDHRVDRLRAGRLVPYARARLATWLAAHRGTARWQGILDEVAAQAGAARDEAGALALLEGWSDTDGKVAPLKTLQGLIWAGG